MKKFVIVLIAAVLCIFTTSLFGQIGLNGIGGFASLLDPDTPGISGMAFGFGARANLGTIGEKIGFGAEFKYWSKGEEEKGFGYTAKLTVSSIHINALAHYNFTSVGGGIRPYAGAGLGLVIGKVKSEATFTSMANSRPGVRSSVPASSSYSESETDLAIALRGGIDYDLSDNLTLNAEFRYSIGGWDYWGILCGVMYNLKK